MMFTLIQLTLSHLNTIDEFESKNGLCYSQFWHHSFSDKRRCIIALLWWVQVLTGAAQSLLPQTKQHALAHVAVNWLAEMFHPPKVLTVRLGHLVVKGAVIEVFCKSRKKKSRPRPKCLWQTNLGFIIYLIKFWIKYSDIWHRNHRHLNQHWLQSQTLNTRSKGYFPSVHRGTPALIQITPCFSDMMHYIGISLSAWSMAGSPESSTEQLCGGWIHAPQASNVCWWPEIAWGEVPGIVVEAKPSDRVQFMVLNHHSDQSDT